MTLLARSINAAAARLVLVVCLLLAPLAARAAGPGVTDQEILLGAFGPLTGPGAWIGLSGRDGLQLAANEINANGGINGRKVRILFEPAQTPAESVTIAKKLVEQDKVFALLIASGSTGAAAAADYVREVGIPAFNMFGATPKIRDPFAKNIFHGVFPDAGLIADFFVEEAFRGEPKPKRIALLAGTYELPQALLRGVQARLEKRAAEIVANEKFDNGAKDFTSQLLSIARGRPDVILFMGNFSEAGLAIKQAPEAGLSGKPWVVDISAISRSVPQLAGRAAEGVRSVWMLPHFHDEPAPAVRDFEAKWKAAYGAPASGRPSYIDMNAYGDLYVLATVLKRVQGELTWESLIRTWEQQKTVKPSDFGPFASDVIFPESFTPTDRDGNKRYSSIIVRNGVWRVVD